MTSKPTLRAADARQKKKSEGASNRAPFDPRTPKKPVRGSAPLARFVKREPSPEDLAIAQAAQAALRKLDAAASRPETPRREDRYDNRRDDRRDFAPRRESAPRRDAPAHDGSLAAKAAAALRALGGDAAPRRAPSRNADRYDRPEGRDRSFGDDRSDRMDRMDRRPRDTAPRRDMAAPPRRSAASAAQAPVQTASHLGPKTEAEKAGGIRLNKRLAELGLCSRREGDQWIENGWVLVNGTPGQMGQTVSETDRIEVSPEAQADQAQQVTILLHKPMGYVSGLPEDGHESAATLIGPQSQWAEDPTRTRFQARFTRGLAPAGRLDIDSTGLIVFTQNGIIARTLIGENSNIEKEYLVRVHWIGDGQSAPVENDVQSVFPEERLALLREGLELDNQRLRPAKVSWQNPEQLRFVLREGKKRQIRRMCELVGLKVVGLKRVRIGSINLAQLPVGQWRYLGPNERF